MKLQRRSLALLSGAAALAVLVAVAVLTSGGDPPTGASVPPTVSPTPAATIPPSGAQTIAPTPAASGAGASPSPSPSVIASALPTPRPAPTVEVIDVAGTWAGIWTNVFPDTEAGALEITLTQAGSELEGTVTFEGNACLTTLPIQGALVGEEITLNVLSRDEVELEGEVAGTTMSGTLSMTCNNTSGTWSLELDG